MTGAVVFFALVLLVGVPAGLLVDRDQTLGSMLGVGFLLGVALDAAILFGMSFAGLRWQRGWVLGATAVLAIVLWSLVWVRRALPVRAGRPFDVYAAAVDAITALVVAGHGIYAIAAPIPENDFLAIWGLKAKDFLIAGGIDFRFLANPWSVLFHPDYPLLLPLGYDSFATITGGWDDRLIGLFTTLFGAAVLLVVRRAFADAMDRPVLGALATLAVSSLVLSPWIGLAEGPLAAFALAGLVLVRRGLASDRPATLHLGALLLGCGGLVKNEGMAVVAAAAIATIVVSRGRMARARHIWPAIALPFVWLAPKWIYGLSTDLARSGLFDRMIGRLEDPIELLRPLALTWVGKPWFWCGVVLAIAVAFRRAVVQERFLAVVVSLQFAAYIGAYLVSPYSLDWHVRWSWERLVSQIAPTLAFLAIVSIAPLLRTTKQELDLPETG